MDKVIEWIKNTLKDKDDVEIEKIYLYDLNYTVADPVFFVNKKKDLSMVPVL